MSNDDSLNVKSATKVVWYYDLDYVIQYGIVEGDDGFVYTFTNGRTQPIISCFDCQYKCQSYLERRLLVLRDELKARVDYYQKCYERVRYEF